MFPHQKLDWHIRRLEGRLEASPDDPAVQAELATACVARAWFHDGGEMWNNRALTQARRVLHHDPQNAEALVVAGLSLVGLDRLDPAARYLDEALRIDPERADLHLALGEMHRRGGDRHRAVRELEMACRLAPRSWEPNLLLGQLLAERAEELGEPTRLLERAQFHLVRALQLDPSPARTPALLHDLGVLCLKSGRHADAQRLFTRLLDHEKLRVKAHYYLGLTDYHLGKYKNAILHLRRYLNERPDHPAVYARIGMSYLQLGEVSKAREACNRALAIEPRSLQARWTKACALLEEGHVDEAVRDFRAILQDAPDHMPAFIELVRIRRDASDLRWLRGALRAEVGQFDRLPPSSPDHRVPPRVGTRERIGRIIEAMARVDDEGAHHVLEAMDLTADETLRFQLWESALEILSVRRAARARRALENPGRHYGASLGREILTLAESLPEESLTRGLQIAEEDLKRAAVDRHGPATDVNKHRANVEAERQEARAWQSMLLLALASHPTRSARNLLVRWASDADPELGDAARAALVMLGDESATVALRARASGHGAQDRVEALSAARTPESAHARPRPVADDEDAHCDTCGRRSREVGHMMAGAEATVCDRCFGDIARTRRDLRSDDPALACALCGHTALDQREIYVHQGVAVCSVCVDHSLGLLEREEIDRFLAAM